MHMPVEQYRSNIASLKSILRKNKPIRNLYLILKLGFFIGFITSLYYAFDDSSFAYPIILLISYIVILVLDDKKSKLEKMTKTLILGYEQEIRYLDGNYSGLTTGEEFISGEHEYSLDLDIFGNNSLFQAINRTVTPKGCEILVGYLQEPCLDSSEILKRQDAIKELSEHNKWTHEFRAKAKLHSVSDYSREVISRWKNIDYKIGNKLKYVLYTVNALCAIFFALAVFNYLPYGYFAVMITLQLLVFLLTMSFINKAHSQLNKVIKSIANYFYLIEHIKQKQFNCHKLAQLEAQLFGESNALLAFKQLNKIKGSFDQRSNILVIATLNALFLRDIHVLMKLIVWRDNYIDHIEEWISAVNEYDALLSMANYRYNHPQYIFPAISATHTIKAEGLSHPLLRDANVVANDFDLQKMHQMYIVTGANMSGKSTFLRSVGVNMVLALSGNVVRSEKFEFKPINLFTSMRTTDNLSQGKSYFNAELLRLKALHEKAENNTPIFIILDEMLKGTNSTDKLNGSLKFLVKLLQLNISGIIATHDLELGKLAEEYPENFNNICFEIEHENNDVVYDYKLKQGVSKNMNASFLLEKMELI